MKATTLTSSSILEIVLLIIFPALAVRPGKEPELEFDPLAPKQYRPLSTITSVEDDAVIDTTEEIPLKCAHLIFNMTRPVQLLLPNPSRSDMVDCFEVCDKKFRDQSKVGFAGLSATAHRNKWTNHGKYTSATYCPMRFSDTCQASGRICVDVLEAFDITADHHSIPNREREADFTQGTCMSTSQTNSGCVSTTQDSLKMSCMCKVRFQLYNSYVGYGIALPGEFFPGRRHDCQPSSICQRLHLRYPGWICELDGEIPGKCPHIRDSADCSQSCRQCCRLKDDHKFCYCNRRGSRSCKEVYSKVLGLKFRTLMPSHAYSGRPFARHWTEDWMQTYSEITKALDASERLNDELRVQVASIEAHIAQHSSSFQSMEISQMLQELAPAEHTGISTAAQAELNNPQDIPWQSVLPYTSSTRCVADVGVSSTEQRQDCTIADAADWNTLDDLFDEEEASRLAAECLGYPDLYFL